MNDDATVPGPGQDSAAESLGPYRLRQPLGQGGMGEVWLAEQTSPIQRKVAIKIIKKGMDSKEVVARFEAERQALALMNHPCVAKVFDAGTTPRGRPYFVMEYVPGSTITEYCDRHRLGIRERLLLFRQVCEGVQHAHQKAILHRDLKPGNILVTEQDGRAVPKIIDFGVAKATSQKLTEQTMFTQLGALIGTPEYMSPEQAELTGEDVDTRTDVYSLGVVLYELLVGALPFDSGELRKAGFEGIRRIIREQDPPLPSTRLLPGTDETEAAASARSVAPELLVRRLRGDLDWIILKALEKERNRRYASPLDLARDIERHLDDEPVAARPPTLSYRASRFLRRNRLPVAFAAIVFVLLLGSGISLALLYSRSLEAERVAADEAATAGRALEFMTGLFRGADPFTAGAQETTARELLDRGTGQLDELDDRPEVQARLLETIGDIYLELGDWDQGKELLRRALPIRSQLDGPDSRGVANLQRSLAHGMTLAEDYDQADQLLKESIESLRRSGNPDDLAAALDQRAFLCLRTERFAEAEALTREGLSLVQASPDRDPHLLFLLGWSLKGQERVAESKAAFEESLALRRAHGQYETPATGWTLNLLGWLLVEQGNLDQVREGIRHLEEAWQLNHRLFDGDHIELAYNRVNAAAGLERLGEYQQAEEYTRYAIQVAERYLDDRGALGRMRRRLARLLLLQGHLDDAEAVARDHLRRLEGIPDAGPLRAEVQTLLNSIRDARSD